MNVSVDELRRVTNILFDHLAEKGVQEIVVGDDFYWSVPDEKLYSVYEQPNGLSIGQLTHDIDRLRKIERGTEPPLGYAFTWLAPVLRYLGSRNVS